LDLIVKIKQVITSLESKISDDDVNRLQNILPELAKGVQNQGAESTIVQMMISIGKHLASRANAAHPDSVPLLAVLAQDFETLVSQPVPLKMQVQEILAKDIRSFKSLKAGIVKTSPLLKSEFEELKAVVLSVDWEISTVTLTSFDQVITKFKAKLESNKLHYTFLKIMHSLGGYISRNKANADKESLKLLQSVFLNYEKLIQNPELPVEEKKRMIESNILAYNEFKRGISGGEVRFANNLQEDEMPPALSHVGSTASNSQPATLSRLPEGTDHMEEIPLDFTDNSKPVADKPIDVMGDLFSPKTTPADELLDEIHLAELHGPNHPNPLASDASDSTQIQDEKGGIKSFVPERGGEIPIPEIESRLDEFFNLDISENSISQLPEVDSDEAELSNDIFSEKSAPEKKFPLPVPELESEIESEIESEAATELEFLSETVPGFEVDDSQVESVSEPELKPDLASEIASELDLMIEDSVSEPEIVPMPELKDESEFEGPGSKPELPMEMIPDDGIELLNDPGDTDKSNWDENLETDPDVTILKRLKNILNTPSQLAEKNILTQGLDDISKLSKLWEAESKKTTLLDLIAGLTRYIHELENTDTLSNDLVSNEPLQGEADEAFFGDALSEDENTDQKGSLAEESELAGMDVVFEDGNEQESSLEENFLIEDKAPTSVWGKIKSKFWK